ncbi:MAG: BamA/TamA family outer membrane protein [Verrucomicrobia bacterium]|nr:BamA/TamA family outer membrane protein [Verrucomicrobiota bacterium]
MGGPNSLRGFEFRDVGPFDGFEPIGGRTYGFGSIEYSVKVAEPLRLALFYDWGFVNSNEFDFNPAGYNDNWGFGIRLLVLGNPLRLDFGLPITSSKVFRNGVLIYDNNRGNQFNFSFGTRF